MHKRCANVDIGMVIHRCEQTCRNEWISLKLVHIPKNDLSALAGAPPDNSQVVSFSAFYKDENGEPQKVSIDYHCLYMREIFAFTNANTGVLHLFVKRKI